jgi:hypothetical protein
LVHVLGCHKGRVSRSPSDNSEATDQQDEEETAFVQDEPDAALAILNQLAADLAQSEGAERQNLKREIIQLINESM